MALLSEFALTPDVFDTASYVHEEVADARLQVLKDALLNEALVRDLREGEWFELFSSPERLWHRRGKELLKKLKLQKRLRTMPPASSTDCVSDVDWCNEALQTHESLPLNGIVVTKAIIDQVPDEPLVCCIDRLSSTPWWSGRSPSVRLRRTAEEYEKHLRLLLCCCNSIMLIDPHFDPTEGRFSDFLGVLSAVAGRSPAPDIEFHRVCYVGSGTRRQVYDGPYWETQFRSGFAQFLKETCLSVHAFIWDDFHDRYIITDLMGIHLGNSLDTSRRKTDVTTWDRLGRTERDDVQREFDPAGDRHMLLHSFVLP